MQSIRDILSYVQESKGYKDLTTFQKIRNNRRDRKLLRSLINAGFIQKIRRIYLISVDGIVLLALVKKYLEDWEK